MVEFCDVGHVLGTVFVHGAGKIGRAVLSLEASVLRR